MRNTIVPILLLLIISSLTGCNQPTNPAGPGGTPTALTQEEIDERHAANYLSAAKDAHSEGQRENAVSSVKELLVKYPDSTAAEEAAQLLAELERPSLLVDEHDASNDVHEWALTGNRIGKLTIRLLFISDGESKVRFETVLTSEGVNNAEETVGITLVRMDSSLWGTEEGLSPSLGVTFDNLIAKSGNHYESVKLPGGLLSLANVAIKEGSRIEDQKTELLYHSAYRSEEAKEGSFGEDFDSMIAASKDGLTFVAITLDWKPN